MWFCHKDDVGKHVQKNYTPAVLEPKEWVIYYIGQLGTFTKDSTQEQSDRRHFCNISWRKKNVLFTLLCLQALPFGPHSSNACFVDIIGENERNRFGDFQKESFRWVDEMYLDDWEEKAWMK